MEKSKKKKGLSRLFEIAGQRKGLLILAGLLSAGSAVCMLVPYWAVYEILKELLSNGSNLSALDGTDMMRWGWIAFPHMWLHSVSCMGCVSVCPNTSANSR